MLTVITNWVRRHPLLSYFVLTYALTWLITLPLGLARQGIIALNLPLWLHYLAPFGPLLAGVIITGIETGRPGLSELWSRITRWHVHPVWWLVALSPVWLFGLGMLVVALSGAPLPDLSLLGQMSYLPFLGIPGALVAWTLTYGLGEEVGWRGYALPRLQRERSALSASIILGLLWALWHWPQFLYHENFMAMGFGGSIMWLIVLLFGVVFLTWLYNNSGGSVLLVIIWHGVFDFFTASQAADGLIAMIMSMVIMVGVAVIILRFGITNLSHRSRHTLPVQEGV